MLIFHTFIELPRLLTNSGSIIPSPMAEEAWKEILLQRVNRVTDWTVDLSSQSAWPLLQLMSAEEDTKRYEYWRTLCEASWPCTTSNKASSTSVTISLYAPDVLDARYRAIPPPLQKQAWHRLFEQLQHGRFSPHNTKRPTPLIDMFEWELTDEGADFWGYVDENGCAPPLVDMPFRATWSGIVYGTTLKGALGAARANTPSCMSLESVKPLDDNKSVNEKNKL